VERDISYLYKLEVFMKYYITQKGSKFLNERKGLAQAGYNTTIFQTDDTKRTINDQLRNAKRVGDKLAIERLQNQLRTGK
jgi:hypothetical protein